MNARPILFSTPMIQALLAGRKTQTRRIVKPQPISYHNSGGANSSWQTKGYCVGGKAEGVIASMLERCPHGKQGDLLYVKEAVGLFSCPAGEEGRYVADGAAACDAWPWKRAALPSMFMPRGLSRLTLEITGVRVERLQEISDEDSIAEGVVCCPTEGRYNCDGDKYTMPYRAKYRGIWISINGKGSWEENPWVWVLEFRVHKQNVDEVLRRSTT
jgi:hypothetical protein